MSIHDATVRATHSGSTVTECRTSRGRSRGKGRGLIERDRVHLPFLLSSSLSFNLLFSHLLSFPPCSLLISLLSSHLFFLLFSILNFLMPLGLQHVTAKGPHTHTHTTHLHHLANSTQHNNNFTLQCSIIHQARTNQYVCKFRSRA